MRQFIFYSVLAIAIFSSCKQKFDGVNGTRIVYHEGTDIVSQSVEFKHAMKNGLWLEFYENGSPKMRQTFLNDSLHDSTIYYHKNGLMSEVQIFKNGSREGCWKKMGTSGKVYHEINFKDDKENGPGKRFTYLTGRVIENLNYKDGKKDGRQEYFYESGKPKSVCYYYEGHPCLGLKEWTESGRPVDNDFKISIEKKNHIAQENKLTFIIRMQNPKPDDELGQLFEESDSCLSISIPFENKGEYFEREYYVSQSGILSRQVKIAAMRKTSFGNVMVKTATLVIGGTNF